MNEIVSRFLGDLGFKKTTADTYRFGLQAFSAFVEASDDYEGLEFLDEECLVAFRQWMLSPRGRGYSPRTTKVYLAATRRFLEWLDIEEGLNFSLVRADRRLQVHQGRRRQGYRRRPVDPRVPEIVVYYDDLPVPGTNGSRVVHEQRLRILRARALVHLLYDTAARVSEAISLTCDDVQQKNVRITGKGDKVRILFLAPETQQVIRDYLDDREDNNPWLFIAHNGTRPGHIARTTAWYIIKQAAVALDLHKGTSPHTFRHYRATQWLNNGMPAESVQALLGHESIATTTTVYTEVASARLREEVDQFSVPARQAAET